MLKNLRQRVFRKALRLIAPVPFQCGHAEHSIISALDDSAGSPSRRLVELLAAASTRCLDIDLTRTMEGARKFPYYYDVWPGDHYRLLAAVCEVMQPTRVLEIGTYEGLGCLTFRSFVTTLNSTVFTNDIIPWRDVAGTYLQERHFSDGKLKQILGDLSCPETITTHREIVESCDLIFVDGPKDGVYEQNLLLRLEELQL